MKSSISYSLLAAAMACGLAQGAATAYTTPVGYATVPIKPGIFNLVGVTLQQPTAVAGIITAVSGTTITSSASNFSVLTPGVVYILEITNGAGNGVIQEIINPPSATTITTPQDISASITPGVTTFSIRKADTLNSAFGALNEKMNLSASTDGSSNGADLVLIPVGDGSYKTYYFVNAPSIPFVGWLDGSDPAGDVVVNYADGVFVQTLPSSAAKNLVTSGEVKATKTSGLLATGFNLLNSVAPAGLTLIQSGLQNSMTPSTDGSSNGADLLLIPDPAFPGAYKTYYYVVAPSIPYTGWLDGSDPADNVNLNGAFFLNKFSAPAAYTVAGPQIAQ